MSYDDWKTGYDNPGITPEQEMAEAQLDAGVLATKTYHLYGVTVRVYETPTGNWTTDWADMLELAKAMKKTPRPTQADLDATDDLLRFLTVRNR